MHEFPSIEDANIHITFSTNFLKSRNVKIVVINGEIEQETFETCSVLNHRYLSYNFISFYRLEFHITWLRRYPSKCRIRLRSYYLMMTWLWPFNYLHSFLDSVAWVVWWRGLNLLLVTSCLTMLKLRKSARFVCGNRTCDPGIHPSSRLSRNCCCGRCNESHLHFIACTGPLEFNACVRWQRTIFGCSKQNDRHLGIFTVFVTAFSWVFVVYWGDFIHYVLVFKLQLILEIFIWFLD